ncbi:thiamine pyrophosphate-binding protein [Cyclobacterium plantarum]|uniref:2-succinyl-5-enolpyruvyl-6-hydroxy-3-cyclohexene-1-carboxylate synthase n=1 Tax=Cyclobacterium plantarum TaxID=2716263 RepID=A0ABX0HBR3_9BACT|nr:thiamine pyrophosphate-binding protein [Cyclobacterium plantarum]NHE59340.1 2-succinyl-5-enolpyruvyl-6-hydroxy-3-cyclohexene-1-carboxylate synthase [Cyclobacterium plantarum]
MSTMYTDEKNVQVLLSLLKAHGIKRIIASPGSSNSPFVASVQFDKYFEVYSSVDERSAAYLACGLAAETNEPVVISCTGATASRNYAPGLTEAFYRKLPVLAITSSQPVGRVGHHIAQVIDRSVIPNDVARLSLNLPIIKDAEDEWDCVITVNKAILELGRGGGGPAHINLQTSSQRTYSTKVLPSYRKINRFFSKDELPKLPDSRIAVFVGSHRKWNKREADALENFCLSTGAVVFCDHTSGYHGKNRLLFSLVGSQQYLDKTTFKPDLMIHIGEVTGDYPSISLSGTEVWRVSPDGEIRDTFRKLTTVFEMDESVFFNKYTNDKESDNSYYTSCDRFLSSLRNSIPELPFSNIYLAHILADKIPQNSVIHFGILNSLRSWNLFELPEGVELMSNVGGFGIDGCVSTLIGASLANRNKIFYCVIGDLAFFYDLNVLGNRHVGNNIRILLVNNGKGTEFKQYKHHTSHFRDYADEYISAAGHFGNQSPTLVKQYAENLGFEYLSATSKEEFLSVHSGFIKTESKARPIVFEVFTNSEDESKALEMMMSIHKDTVFGAKSTMKQTAKGILGDRGMALLRKNLGKK